jgi:hypothetical protein
VLQVTVPDPGGCCQVGTPRGGGGPAERHSHLYPRGRPARRWQAPRPRAHRAVLADALTALDGLLVVVRDLAVKRLQLDVHAQVVVEEAAGAVLGLGTAPGLARVRLAVGVDLAGFACDVCGWVCGVEWGTWRSAGA